MLVMVYTYLVGSYVSVITLKKMHLSWTSYIMFSTVFIFNLKVYQKDRALWLTPVIQALWEARRADHEVRRSRPSWLTR